MTCGASLYWEITPEVGDKLACGGQHGHTGSHFSELVETRSHDKGRVRVEIMTTVEWTEDAN